MIKRILASAHDHAAHLRSASARSLLKRSISSGPLAAEERHLAETMAWLCRAQDATGTGGVSMGYSLRHGWRPPYPETTGYIIPTFLVHARYAGDAEYAKRAVAMGDWELSIQRPDGSFAGGESVSDRPIVFDTGQIVFGLSALAAETGEDRFLEAARRGGDWLLERLDQDGCWRRDTYHDRPHAYNARTAWALCELAAVSGDQKYLEGASANIGWVLTQAEENGYVRGMEFEQDEIPLTHTMVYTYRGLYECSRHLRGPVAEQAGELVLKALAHWMEVLGNGSGPLYPPGRYNQDWSPGSTYSCLTGNAQLGILALRLAGGGLLESGRDLASRLVDGLLACQSLNAGDGGVRGGVPGSRPLWGGYQRYTLPNWSAKFLCDLLLARLGGDPVPS